MPKVTIEVLEDNPLKVGIRIPKFVEEEYQIDRETGTDYQHETIETE